MTRAWPIDGLDPDAPTAENARRILAVRMAELFALEPAMWLESAVSHQHDLRIAAKRLRYTLELFRAEFGESGERQIERAKALQEALGALHDHDVQITLVEDELLRIGTESIAALLAEVAATTSEEVESLATTALRPPPDDPRRGLLALLGREHARRRTQYRDAQRLWWRLADEGFRAELTALSASPIAAAGKEGAAG